MCNEKFVKPTSNSFQICVGQMKVVKKFKQTSPFESPWSTRRSLHNAFSENNMVAVLCRHTPKPFYPWRIFVLHVFGAKIQGIPFVLKRAKIEIRENLYLRHRACLGKSSVAYSIWPIEFGEGATIAQEAYLCTGMHDFDDPALPLLRARFG